MKEINLGWGESVAIRNAFLDAQGAIEPFRFGYQQLAEMGYTPHEGNFELIELTKRIIHRQTGIHYNHVLLTNGATGGVTISLRMFAQKGAKTVVTRKPPFFPVYPEMIKSAGLIQVHGKHIDDCYAPVILIDSPANPTGEVEEMNLLGFTYVVWDAVYHTNAYTNGLCRSVYSDVMVGSYSKLTGLNGTRVGWIATNDPLLYGRLKSLVTAEYCGLPSPSTNILTSLLKTTDWDEFEKLGRKYLNRNREEWSKLEKYFGDQPVYPNGMFYYAPIDAACDKLLRKSNIVWTLGSQCGHDDSYGRFNLGQDCKLVRSAVKTILKNDRI